MSDILLAAGCTVNFVAHINLIYVRKLAFATFPKLLMVVADESTKSAEFATMSNQRVGEKLTTTFFKPTQQMIFFFFFF